MKREYLLCRKNYTKKIILLFSGVFAIAIFFLVPANRQWFNTTAISYWHNFLSQKNNLDIEKRKISRFGPSYTHSREIVDFIKMHTNKDVLVLIPPSAYFSDNGIDYHVPEPAVFYYYTGVKTTWAHFNNASDANWYLSVKDGRIMIGPVTNKDSLQAAIEVFKKYRLTL